MSDRAARADGWYAAIRVALLLPAASYLALFVLLSWMRMGYPWELEWMEGACVDHAARLLSGHPLYVAPSVDFVPFIYTPLYFHLGAWMSRIVGVGFFPLRFLSWLGAIGCMAILCSLTIRETRSRLGAAVSVGLFAASYALSGFWFDIARTDMVCLWLVLCTFYTLRVHPTALGSAVAGLALTAAVATKQTALVMAAPMLLFALVCRPRQRVWFVITAAASLTMWMRWQNTITDGWFSFYVIDLPRHHAIVPRMVRYFWELDILPTMGIACGLAGLWWTRQLCARRWETALFYGCAACGMLGAAWLGRIHEGGWLNVLIPAHAALALLAGLCVGDAWGARKARGPSLAVGLACLLQFIALVYDPRAQLPSRAHDAAWRSLMSDVRNLGGEVFAPFHGFIAARCGRTSHAHQMAIDDVLRAGDNRGRKALLRSLRLAIRRRRYAAIVVDSDWLRSEFRVSYSNRRQVRQNHTDLLPVTGHPTAPRWMLTPEGIRHDDTGLPGH